MCKNIDKNKNKKKASMQLMKMKKLKMMKKKLPSQLGSLNQNSKWFIPTLSTSKIAGKDPET
jgi:hypothetical protein